MSSKKYKVLVLTDHRKHSKHNSLYPIVREMLSHDRCLSVDIANRGIAANDGFYKDMDQSKLMVMSALDDFSFTDEHHVLERADLINVAAHKSYDLVLLRLPRPISDEFLLWIESIFKNATIVNRPSGIIKTSNKSYLLNFPKCCAPMKQVQSIDEVLDYSCDQAIVLKPLREYGGRGLLKISQGRVDDGTDIHAAKEYLPTIKKTLETEGYLAMKFLKNVDQGDKRIIVVGGDIMGSSLRLPAKDSWLCNVSQGGKTVSSPITEEEKDYIYHIAPYLQAEGILMYGVDTLVNDDGLRVISEINTLSIGGFEDAQQFSGKPIIKITVEKIYDQCS